MNATNKYQLPTELKKSLDDAHADMVNLAHQREEFRRKAADGILTEEYARAEIEAIERKIAKVHDDCERNVYGLIDKHIEELDVSDTLNADELNDDCRLLQFDFLTQKDVDQIAKRNSSNATMSRLVARYAEAHGLEAALPSFVLELANDRRETEGMREAVRVCLKWIGDERSGQGVLNRLFPKVGA